MQRKFLIVAIFLIGSPLFAHHYAEHHYKYHHGYRSYHHYEDEYHHGHHSYHHYEGRTHHSPETYHGCIGGCPYGYKITARTTPTKTTSLRGI